MSDKLASDLDLEQQAKFDKELAWCIRKLFSKVEHEKDNKKINDLNKSINILKNPSELLVKKRQVMFKTFGDYRAKMKNEDSKKPLGKEEVKIKFVDQEKKENSNDKFKFIKKSSSNQTNQLSENLSNLKLENDSFKMTPSEKIDFKFNFDVKE